MVKEKPAIGWKRPKRTQLNNLDLQRGESLAQRNNCLHSDLRKSQDRTGWHRLIATTTFWHGICDDDHDDIYDSEHRLEGPAS